MVLRKRDDLANRICAYHHLNDAVDAGRDAAVRRRAIRERFQQEAKTLLDLFVRVPQELEDSALRVRIVYSDGTAPKLRAVQHDIVVLRAKRKRIAGERLGTRRRRRERVVHRLQSAGLGIALEKRKVQHPAKFEALGIAQALRTGDVQAKLAGDRAGNIDVVGYEQHGIPRRRRPE